MASVALIGSTEALEILGVDRSTLIRWVVKGKVKAEGKLPGETGAWLFERAEIERVAREQAKAS